MSYNEENLVLALEENLKDEEERYAQLKIITIIVGILALLLLGWVVYTSFFVENKKTLSYEDLKQSPYVITLNDSINKLNNQIIALETAATETETLEDETLENESFAVERTDSLDDQIVYSIQIGAFEQKELSLYSESFSNFKEIKEGNYNKYSIGNFEHLYEAQELLNEIIAMGLKDAFIASYTNGERIKIEEAY